MVPNNSNVRVVGLTVPKAGTHLLDSILSLMPGLRRKQRAMLNTNLRYHPYNILPGPRCLVGIGRPIHVNIHALRWALNRISPGQYGLGYIPFQNSVADEIARQKLSLLVVLRDPRDICISAFHHIMTKREHYLHSTLRAADSDKERFAIILRGAAGSRRELSWSAADQIRAVADWRQCHRALVLRFEDLVGEMGGGNADMQFQAIQSIAEHLDVEIGSDQVRAIGTGMFGSGRTFRKGRIEGWRDQLDPEIAMLFDHYIGDVIAQLGYPPTIPHQPLAQDRLG